jgi:CSLREA domain-containing protein
MLDMQTTRKALILVVLAMMLASARAMAANVPVTVTITKVTNISAGDVFSRPDFFARINIAGASFESPRINNTANIEPGWTFTTTLRQSANPIPIRIEIWDSDTAFEFGDDLVDVDPDVCAGSFWFGCANLITNRPDADTRGLDLDLDLTTRTWKGFSSSPTADASGSGTAETCVEGTESDSAKVCFTIVIGDAVPEVFVVTKTDDTNNKQCLPTDCSLREAVAAASDGDTVIVPDLGRYLLTYKGPSDDPGHLKITQKDLKICGRDEDGGAVILQTVEDRRVFEIHGGASVDMCNLTISGGTAGPSTAVPGHLHGGGIHNHGTATLWNVTISNNKAPYTSVGGGGGFYNAGVANLTNVTISQNTANIGAGGIEGSGTTNLTNTLIANNTGPAGNCTAQGLDPKEGGNLQFPGTTCGTAIPTAPALPISAADTKETYPLRQQGGAIDGGTNTGCPSKDQLGLQRPSDGNNDGNSICDVGAREMPPGITLPVEPEGITMSSSPRSPHPAH